MKTKQIKNLLNKAVCKNVPNLLDSILQEPILKKEVFEMDTEVEKKSRNKFIIPAVASLAICSFAFLSLYLTQNQVSTLLSLDVNPSIELVLNNKEKVIKCVAKNNDAKNIIGDMKLKNLDADIALNAIVGSLYKSGYLEKNTKDNDILLSIDNKDKVVAQDLEKKYTDVLKTTLKNNHTNAKILSQKDILDNKTKILSEIYKISEGKALLINKMIQKSPELKFEKLSTMNIKELTSYINTNNMEVDDLDEEDVYEDEQDRLNEIKEDAEDKAKETQEKKEEAIKDTQDKIKETQEKEQDKIKETQEKEQERIKKEQEKIKKEQEKMREQMEQKQERMREQIEQEQERIKNVQDKMREQMEQKQEQIKQQQERIIQENLNDFQGN
ncbi:MAG: hypothetical protein RSE41_01980 [Clostridia bacterium]